MVEYVDSQTDRVLAAVQRLALQFENHEKWHQSVLEKQLAALRSDLWKRRGQAVLVATLCATSASTFVLLIGHVKFH
jgi:hypothetical protein